MRRLLTVLLIVSGLQKANSQVHLQTGSAEFQVPVFSWEDDKSKMASSVSISYTSANGLKVNDIASNIGQGWHLQIGGSITRMQSGEPDDQIPRDGNYDDITKYPHGFLYDQLNASDGCPWALRNYPIFKAKNKVYKEFDAVAADKELDRFAFEINGRSGIFFLSKTNFDKAFVLGDSKLKIWFTRNENMPDTRTAIDAFYIQDENGILYTFSNLESAKSLRVGYSDANATAMLTQPTFTSGNVYFENSFNDGSLPKPYIVNSWMLTQMEDLLTHRVVKFNYVMRNTDMASGTNVSYYAEKNYSVISHLRTVSQSPEISTIEYPDGHIVNVNYGDERFDFPGQLAVNSIDVWYNGRYLSKYFLNTSYFLGNRIGKPQSDFEKSVARLCLTSISRVGVDLLSADNPYKFDYYLGSSDPYDVVPAPYSYLKDPWGYYNGDQSTSYTGVPIPPNTPINSLTNGQLMGLCFLRIGSLNPAVNPKINYAQNGLLKKITFPTNGSLQYEYTQNAGNIGGNYSVVGGVHVSKTTSSDEGNNYNCDVTNLQTNYNYASAENSSESSLWGLETPIEHFATYTYYAPESKKYHWGLHGCGILGCCKYKYKYPGILAREQATDLTGHQKFLEALSSVLDVVSMITTVIDIVVVVMGETGFGAIAAVVLDAISALYTLISTCFKDYSKGIWSNTYYDSDLNNNPLPIQYSRVEVTESSGGNGKTVYDFTSPADYPIWEPTNPAFSNKQRYAYWAYGLPKATTVYTTGGRIVKQTSNTYDYSHARSYTTEIYNDDGLPETISLNGTSCKCLATRFASERSDHWMNPDLDPDHFIKTMTGNYGVMMADIYQMSTGRVELQKTTDRVYSMTQPTQYAETSKDYTYDPHTFLPSSVTTRQSNGDQTEESTIYSGNTFIYGSGQGQALHALITNNILDLPISTRSTITRASDGQQYDLNETVTRYDFLPDGEIKPSAVLTHRYAVPSPIGGSNLYYQGPDAAANPPYDGLKYFNYDNNANLADVWGQFYNSREAYIYDYNDKFITAKIINAGSVGEKNNTCYTSFETSKENGWHVKGNVTYANDALTGARALVLDGCVLYSDLVFLGLNNYTPQTPYAPTRLTFWATGNATVSCGGNTSVTLVSEGPERNGYKFYEYRLASTLSTNQLQQSSVTLKGTGRIDEVRLYRSDARMETTTYDPLLGKTSECDVNNRVTYYEYDEKGRLRFIKDDKRNIVKCMSIITATPSPQSCHGSHLYSNLLTSEVFTMQCPKGDFGTDVTYTVPAGTYTSAISQAVVDLEVQMDLAANGQAYANAHGQCLHVYNNVEKSQTFYYEDCDEGYTGAPVVYDVPAGKYHSVISQDDADAQAQAEIDANGQAYANSPGVGTCVIDLTPDWEGTDAPTQCGTGALAGEVMVQVIDVNPNSPTYNTTQWTDGGPSAACGGNEIPFIDITYTNAGNMQVTVQFTNLATNDVYSLNLDPNTTTSAVSGFVPQGNYDVSITLPYGSNAQNISVYGTTQTGSFHQTPVSITTSPNPIIRITL